MRARSNDVDLIPASHTGPRPLCAASKAGHMTAPGHTQHLFCRFSLLWSGRPHMPCGTTAISPSGRGHTVGTCYVRPGFIDEHQAFRVLCGLQSAPRLACRRDIRAGLFGSMAGLFFTVSSRRRSVSHITAWLTEMPWVANVHARSSAIIISGTAFT